jgi:ketosteroid isomerase-like protein
LVSEIQAATTNAGTRAQGRLTPDLLTLSYTEDAVFVTPQGPLYGREAIEKFFADVFKQVHFSNHLAKADSNSIRFIGTAGNEVWRNGDFSETETLQGQNGGPMQVKGYWSAVEVREGDAWKHRMCTFNVTPASAPAQTK